VADPEAGRELEAAFGVAADNVSGVEADVLRVVSDLLGRAGQRVAESNALPRRTPACADLARLAARPEGRVLARWIAGRVRRCRAILEWPRGIRRDGDGRLDRAREQSLDRTLRDKVGIVSGAGPGIGRATALAFARDGADVVVAARRHEPLAALAQEIAAETGRRVLAVPCDITDPAACTALVERTVAELGRVDVLVNVATSKFLRQRVVDFDWSSYSQSVQLNVVGTMQLCGETAKKMVETGGGSIINIGTLSTTAVMAKNAEYSSTKLAMIAMSKTMAREMGRENIRVNIVTPGFTTGVGLTRLFEEMGQGTGKTGEEMSRQMASTTELKRHVDPEDIAEACLYLGSDRARNVTGIELHVTAGALIV